MIDTKNKKTIQELEKEFYSKPFILSYSGLNKLLFSPKMYYNHYVLNQREDRIDSHLIDGKVIHCLMLNNHEFENNFVLLPSTLPTGNSRTVIDKVHNIVKAMDSQPETELTLADLGTHILDILKEINLHQSLKTDDQRLSKIITEETISYFEFLKSKGNRDLIDSETLQRCNEAVTLLKADSTVCDLLGLYNTEMENIDMLNEIALSSDNVGIENIGLKGIADSIQINHDKKTIYINDLKTTGKTITDFPETIEFYNYNVQAAIYTRLVKDVYKHIITSDWKVIFNFIVIDKYNQVYCFEISSETLALWDKILVDKLIEAHWHYKNNNYSLPYKFAASKVIL